MIGRVYGLGARIYCHVISQIAAAWEPVPQEIFEHAFGSSQSNGKMVSYARMRQIYLSELSPGGIGSE